MWRGVPARQNSFGHQPNGGYRYTCRGCVRKKVSEAYYDDPFRSLERSESRRDTTFSQSERAAIRARLVLRDGGFFCFYCKDRLDESYHIDHKAPISSGGRHEFANFALACLQCNQEKYNKDLEGYRAWLHKNGESVRF
jgi:hypothetical protein